MSVATNPH